MNTNERPTPETDKARIEQNVRNQGIPDKDWPWAAISSGFEFARKLERERDATRNAIITKGVEMEKQLEDMREAIKEAHELMKWIELSSTGLTLRTASEALAKLQPFLP